MGGGVPVAHDAARRHPDVVREPREGLLDRLDIRASRRPRTALGLERLDLQRVVTSFEVRVPLGLDQEFRLRHEFVVTPLDLSLASTRGEAPIEASWYTTTRAAPCTFTCAQSGAARTEGHRS